MTPEADGTGEIEVRAVMSGRFSSVVVHGTVFPDRLEFGRSADGVFGANLNASLETAPDVDLVLEQAEIVAVEGRRGADRIVASGGAGFAGPLAGRTFAAGGGAGWDRIVGARSGNILIGGDGRDRLTGSKRTDYLEGGDAPDVLLAGRGADFVGSKRGGPDRVDCGGGNDFSVVDGKDKVRSCGGLPRKRKGKRRFNKLVLRLFPAIFLVDDVYSSYSARDAAVAALPEPPAEAPVPPLRASKRPGRAE